MEPPRLTMEPPGLTMERPGLVTKPIGLIMEPLGRIMEPLGRMRPGRYFPIRCDTTISIARLTVSDSVQVEQPDILVQKLCAWWSTRHGW
jgi:hypothetical protein